MLRNIKLLVRSIPVNFFAPGQYSHSAGCIQQKNLQANKKAWCVNYPPVTVTSPADHNITIQHLSNQTAETTGIYHRISVNNQDQSSGRGRDVIEKVEPDDIKFSNRK
jgi:hypothetical protein